MSILELKILKVLDSFAKSQTNLGSHAAREMIAKNLAHEINESFETVILRAIRPHAALAEDTQTLDICVDLDDNISY